MNFKDFYTEQEKQRLEEARLLEFGEFGTGLSSVASGAGKVAGGISKLAGKAIGGVAKYAGNKIGGAVADVATKVATGGMNVTEAKEKLENAVSIAEQVYPHDKKIYDDIKKNQNKAGLLAQYIAVTKAQHMLGQKFLGYSPGLDIVFRAQKSTQERVLAKMKTPKGKTSMLSLEEALKYKNIGQFKLMKDMNDVKNFFDTATKNPTSSLSKWIDNATYFSYWKNKYEGHDDERVSSNIVSDLLSEGLLRLFDPEKIDKTMDEMEKDGIEINVDNLKKELNIGDKELLAKTKEELPEILTLFNLSESDISKDKVTDEDINAFIKSMRKRAPFITNANYFTRLYVCLSYLAKKHGFESFAGTLAKQTSFASLFSAKGRSFGHTAAETIFQRFITLVSGGYGFNFTGDLLKDSEKLYDILNKTPEEMKQINQAKAPPPPAANPSATNP